MSLKSEFKIMIIKNKTVTCACECSDKQAHIATELTIETIRNYNGFHYKYHYKHYKPSTFKIVKNGFLLVLGHIPLSVYCKPAIKG